MSNLPRPLLNGGIPKSLVLSCFRPLQTHHTSAPFMPSLSSSLYTHFPPRMKQAGDALSQLTLVYLVPAVAISSVNC